MNLRPFKRKEYGPKAPLLYFTTMPRSFCLWLDTHCEQHVLTYIRQARPDVFADKGVIVHSDGFGHWAGHWFDIKTDERWDGGILPPANAAIAAERHES